MKTSLLFLSLVTVACRNDKLPEDTATEAVDPLAEDVDADGYTAAEDCDDNNSLVNPGAAETCDGADNNCDGEIDEGVTTTFYIDSDTDGFGDPDGSVMACEAPSGYVSVPNDCDDDDAETYPGAAERCDGIDNDCDGDIDEGVTTVWYADADGDRYGNADSVVQDCDPPEGYVSDDTDCDDLDSTAYPGGTETCDGVDNNCDGDIDEGVTSTYYTDADNDNYGVAESTTEACTRPNGYAAQSGDCADSDASINPAMTELCDGFDNDCDGTTDEDDAADAETWYQDSDGDGFGGSTTSTVSCAPPSGYVEVGAGEDFDCDDTAFGVNPDAEEVCDDIDNDCDGDIDDDDSSVTGTTDWYLDYDGDGFGGETVSVRTCTQPSGYTDAAADCDDTNDSINPDADEQCNGEDDDCDGDIDEDAIDPGTWYADTDEDGYGDPDVTTQACDPPSGYIDDDRDCDDGASAINPSAEEVCDDLDNDCDGDTDEDAIDSGTWYADTDEDGYGDPNVTTQACDPPSGYVDNSDDCDDSDDGDIDEDGLQDCDDGDIDGDGLRNDWDADPEDSSVDRPPTGGLGVDGDLTVSGETVLSEWTLLDGGASAGDDTLVLVDASGFIEGDELLVLSQQGTDAGTYQSVMVSSAGTGSVDIEPPLHSDYDSGSTVLVYRVPHYEDVSVQSGGVLTGDAWAGSGGGVVMFRATGAVTIDGSVLADGMGFAGGTGVYGNDSDPTQGESHPGLGSAGDTAANGGGGGAHYRRGDNADSGGGGSYGAQGGDGLNYYGSSVCDSGDTYGDTALADWFLGSGGGGGSPDTESDGDGSTCYAGDGGSGGGLIGIFAAGSLTISGTISANGADGIDAVSPSSSQGEVGGGGGGSGGQLYLAAPTISISGTVRAEGGSGGSSASYNISTPYGSAYGGDGGTGRLRLDYDSLSGSPTTSAAYEASFED